MIAFWRGLTAIMYKEVRHIVREPVTLALIFAMPIMQLTIYGYAINLHIQHIKTVAYNADRGRFGSKVLASMQRSQTFDIVGNAVSAGAIRALLVSGGAQAAIIIPAGFSAAVDGGDPVKVQFIVDGSDATLAQAALGAADRAAAQIAVSASGETPAVQIERRVLFNPSLRTPNFLVPGLIALLMLNLTTVLTLLAIVGERERGTLDQLRVTPISPPALMLGKMLPYGVIGFIDFLLVLAIMVGLFGVPIAGNVALLVVLGGASLLTGLGLGLLISTFARSQLQALFMSLFYVLPSFLLSGMFFRVDLMPRPMQVVAYALPLTYVLQILRGIILRGAGLPDLWTQAAALIGIGLAAIALASMRFARTFD